MCMYISQDQNTMDKKNSTLERESLSGTTLAVFSTVFLSLDIWRQMATYGMKYINDDKYPVPQTKIIAVIELIKLIMFAFILSLTGSLRNLKVSLWYVIPSVIYAINSNVYLFALHYCTPPIWNVFIQLRLIITALVYRFFIKRILTKTQWFAILILMAAIASSHFISEQEIGDGQNLSIAFILAIFGSVTSVFGTITMEFLFKNDSRSFVEMQVYLYFFGAVCSWIFYGFQYYHDPPVSEWEGQSDQVLFLLTVCVILSILTGVTVATIVKKLDNIVKLYLQAVSNMVTSIACAFFFPDRFRLTFPFFLCLLTMCVAIVLYEKKSINFRRLVSRISPFS